MMKNRLLLFALLIFVVIGCQVKSKGDIVVSQLKKASKLSAVEVVITKNIFNKGEMERWKKMFGIGKNQVILFKSEARIKLGIDLSKITSDNIKYLRGDRIDIELPPVEVTNFSYPAENFMLDSVISDVKTINTQNDFEQIDKLFREAELDIWNKIDLLNVRKKAQGKTSILIERLLKNMGFEVVNISFKEPDKIYKYTIDSTYISH